MKTEFACPSCGAKGSVDDALVGKHARCKHCGHRFTIPSPGEPEPEVYGLDEPPAKEAGPTAMNPPEGSVFVSFRGDEPRTAASPRKSRQVTSGSTTRNRRRSESGFAWGIWLVRGGIVAALVLAAIALFAPRGTMIAGSVLILLGSAMVMAGYGAGAYGAFREDFLYGFLYVVFPLYAGYYLLTRWDDLWVWFACSTAGVALVLLGEEMIRWTGAGA